MSWLSQFLHPQRGYEGAQDELNKYFNMSNDMMNPYNQHGQDAYNGLSEAMNKLLNPAGLQDEWSKNYKESDYAKNLEDQASQRGLNAASSMGIMGSTPALQAIQAGTSQIGAADKQQYMQDLMQKYLAGAGLGQGIYNTGAGMAGQMGQNAMNMGRDSAQMRFGRDTAGGNLFGDLFGRLLGGAGGALAKFGLGGM